MAGLGDLNEQFGYRNGKFDYYISEPVVENDPKGVGPLMMARAEQLL
jgi:unsaturated rhamnogalacturonyl hydrolase